MSNNIYADARRRYREEWKAARDIVALEEDRDKWRAIAEELARSLRHVSREMDAENLKACCRGTCETTAGLYRGIAIAALERFNKLKGGE